MHNWHIPNPSDSYWNTFEWSTFGHEVAHDLIGFSDNISPRRDRPTVMARSFDPGPVFVVTEFDIGLLFDSQRVIHAKKWETCRCN
jgi:hypothetical protein